MRSLRMIVSGGGTGGHIFPAIAIADAVKALVPEADILFVGARDRMEMEKVPAAGYPIEGLWISGFSRSFSLSNLLFPFKVIGSLLKAGKIVRQFKPDLAVGTGGYASGPLLRAAAHHGVITAIQEQNSLPGITNRILGKRAKKVFVAYDGMERYFDAEKLVLAGNPVRTNVVDIEGKRDQALKHFELSNQQPVLLVVGGSLGARSVNEAIAGHLQQLIEKRIQLIWQTGTLGESIALEAVKKYSANGVVIKKFIHEMDLAYAAADVVVSRAGAIAVSELQLVAKPCVFVPFPHAAEDHQTKNAQALLDKQAAFMVADAHAKEKLVPTAVQLIENHEQREILTRNMRNAAKHHAARRIAEELIELVDLK